MFIQRIAWSGVFLVTHIGDFQSCPGHIGCPWFSYSPGQLLDGHIHLLLEEACLGIFNSVSLVLFWGVREILLSEKMMVMHWCLFVFRAQQLRFSPGIIITSILIWPLLTLTGDSQYFKLGGGVLYHRTSGQIFHAPRQDPSHSDDDVTQYMCYIP